MIASTQRTFTEILSLIFVLIFNLFSRINKETVKKQTTFYKKQQNSWVNYYKLYIVGMGKLRDTFENVSDHL